MYGLSFREYLEMTHQVQFDAISLEDLCKNHQKNSDVILQKLKQIDKRVLSEFLKYLKMGYYPYFAELQDSDAYAMTLEKNFHAIIEVDLAAAHPQLTGGSIKKIKQLLIFIASAVPFTPNWSKIQSILDIGDLRTLKTYFFHLETACLVRSISKASSKLSKIESSDKIYLDNTNQLFSISSSLPDPGTVRETFFLSMLAQSHEVTLPLQGDFLVDQKYLFEVGGKNKKYSQIKGLSSSFLACDGIEIGSQNKIPLWLLGFLY